MIFIALDNRGQHYLVEKEKHFSGFVGSCSKALPSAP